MEKLLIFLGNLFSVKTGFSTRAPYPVWLIPHKHITSTRFRVATCNEAKLLLTTKIGDTVGDMYQVSLGAVGNTMAQLWRQSPRVKVTDSPAINFMDCNKMSEFWMDWGGSQVKLSHLNRQYPPGFDSNACPIVGNKRPKTIV